MLVASVLHFSAIFIFDYGIVPTEWYFYLSFYYRDVPAKTHWSSTAMLEPHVNGNVQVNVSFGCRELKDVTGLILIAVAV